MKKTLSFFLCALCLVLTGCGSTTHAPTLNFSGTQAIDAGQSINITSNEDVTWALSGPGSLANQTARSVTYNAPAVGTFIARKAGANSSAVPFAPGADPTATVTATSKASASKVTSLTINLSQPPSITTTSLQNGIVGTAYSQTVAASGGAGTLTFTVSSGTLPAGLTMSSAGAITGTPTMAGTSSFTVKVTDSSVGGPLSATQNLSITVNQAPAITSASSVTFVEGTASTFTVTTTGTPTPSLAETGALPSGVTFKDNGNGTGTLSGTPAAGTAANYPITFTASNGAGTAATQNFTLTVGKAPAITSPSATTFTAGTAGTFTVTATGFPAPTFSETGALPTGVTFNSTTGVLSGTPAAGTGKTYSIMFTASNGVSSNATQNFTLTVDETPAITSANKTTFSVSTLGTFAVTASGFPTPSLAESGTLPTGVTFVDNHNGTGTLAGTPAPGTAGNYPITFTPSNGVGSPAGQNFTLTVGQAPAITSGTSTTFTVGTAGTFSVTTTGFPAPSLTETGALPSGVTFKDNGNGTGTLSGTPAAGTGKTYAITFTASNGVGSNATQNFTLTVNEAPSITSAISTTFSVGAMGTFTVTATGFPAPTFGETGTLPTGVTFNTTTGVLSGVPATGTNGTYSITFTASNGVLPNATQSFTLTVNTGPVITSANSTTFTVGTNGSFTVTATGTPTPTLTETGTLPTGVTFNATTGVLSGTPGAGTGGTYAITFKATNSAGSNSQSFTLTVDQAPAITSPNATTFTVGTSGSFTVMTTGLPAPSLSDGGATLPSGVMFVDNGNGTGTLSGTPASGSAGMYSITFTASNGVLPNATQSFTLTVNTAPVITSANMTTFSVGTNGTFTVMATGTPAPTLSETGTLPAGVTFNATTGVLSGTPGAGTGGTYSITFKATSTSGTTSQSFTLTVDEAPTITSPNSTTFTVGSNGSFTITTTGFPQDPITEAGPLPTGVTFVDNGNNTATLSGTPAAGTAGSYPIVITASNGVLPNATQAFTLTVTAAPAMVSTSVGNFNVPFFAGNPGTTITITVTNDAPGDVVTAGLTMDANTTFNCTMATCGTLGAVTGTSGSGTYSVSYTPPPSSPNFIQTFPTLVVNSSLPGAIGSTDFIEVDPAGILVTVFGPTGPTLGGTVFVGVTPADTRTFTVNIFNDTTRAGVTFGPLTAGGYACSSASINLCGTLGAATAPTYTTDTSTGTNVSVGSLTIPYTAPAALPAAPYDTPLVEAISLADNTRSGSVAFLLANDPAAPNLPSMFILRNRKFKTALIGTPTNITARILNDSGPSKTVNWTLTAGGANCSPACGTLGSPTVTVNGSTVTSTITYTPPATVPAGASATPTITATSADNPPGGTDNFTFNILDPTCGTGNEKVLNGQYAFLLKGGAAGGGYVVLIGSFTADGAGHITGGLLDVNTRGFGAFLGATLLTAAQGQLPASSYSVGADNRGCLMLTDSTGGFETFRFAVGTMVTVNGVSVATQGRIIRFDDVSWRNRSQSGVIYRQNPTSFATNQFNGNYAFGEEGVDSSGGRFAGAGVITSDGAGHITSLIGDFDDAGVVSGAATGGSGTYTAPNANGRATGTTTLTVLGKPTTSNFVVYMVSSSQALLMTTDLISTGSAIYSGELKKQTGPFTATTLDSNDYVFYLKGIGSTGGNSAAIAQLTFTTMGNATLTLDDNDNGILGTEKVGPVTVAIAANGRATVTGTGSGKHPPIVYLIDSSTAFLVGTSGAVESGFGEMQTGGPFSTASISGLFFFGGDAPVTATLYESGTATFDGAGNVTGTGDHSGSSGLGIDTISPTNNGGTYSFSSTSTPLGKGTVGPTAIAYAISGSKLIFMNTGNNVAIFVVQK